MLVACRSRPMSVLALRLHERLETHHVVGRPGDWLVVGSDWRWSVVRAEEFDEKFETVGSGIIEADVCFNCRHLVLTHRVYFMPPRYVAPHWTHCSHPRNVALANHLLLCTPDNWFVYTCEHFEGKEDHGVDGL